MKTRRGISLEKQREEIAKYPADPVERKRAINRSYSERHRPELLLKKKAYYKRVKVEKQEVYNQRNREQYDRMHRAALVRIGDIYGIRCRCCGEENPIFLTIHHVEGGGNKHRDSFSSQHAYYKYLSIEAPLDKFQVLCMNCNHAERFGPCPHLAEVRVEIL